MADMTIKNEYWIAIVMNDASYDDLFFYGVTSTGIFCRPSCKSRVPNKENVRIFKNAELAIAEAFRPCKRCKPDGLQLPDEEWISHIVEWIDTHFQEPLTLEILAEMSHGSPYHLQRTFKKMKGMTPNEYIQGVRLAKAVEYLKNTDMSVTEIGSSVGFSNTAYFITWFKQRMKRTPANFRKR
ncbi:bifunctional transcriptional activator/DNA repair enzyme AdaA [Geomicrobium halophilum]|nr:bifunctional transcriptional activator/DNA repair enzyme AdaA [Geomicrobium halophilum]